MNIHLPTAPDRFTPAFFNHLLLTLRRAFAEVVSKDEETPRIVLRSPNGTNYDVTVSDAGALTVTPTEKTRA